MLHMAYCLQKTVEAALATVLQTAGYGLLICADEWQRVFRMSGSVDDVCGANRSMPTFYTLTVLRQRSVSLARGC